MENQGTQEREEERAARLEEQRQRMRRERQRRTRLRWRIRYGMMLAGCALVLVGAVFLFSRILKGSGEGDPSGAASGSGSAAGPVSAPSGEPSQSGQEAGGVPESPEPAAPGGEGAGQTPGPEDGSGQESGEAGEPSEPQTPAGIGRNDRISADGSRIQVGDVEFVTGYEARETDATHGVDPEQMTSTYAVLIDESTGEIVAQQNARTVISPASMTKILTLLVAAEHVSELDDTFTMTIDITDYVYVHDCSAVGFSVGEQIPVKDLFYGTILPSGADAAMALAVYTAGSQEAFVELMNDKLKELGLDETAHFTNCIGLYDEDHHCTVYDMAMILKAAVENDFCREILSAHTYTTAATPEHPEGILISNWFLRRIEDKDTGGEVLCGKTGFVNESGSCAASYQISESGTPYICVTADAHSSWRCIYDHVAMYSLYAK